MGALHASGGLRAQAVAPPSPWWTTAEALVRAEVSPSRWEHVQGVVATAGELVGRHGPTIGVDAAEARMAALLHDAARDWDGRRLLEAARRAGLDPDPVEAHAPQELLHGFVAADWARSTLGVTGAEVLDAIRYHTTGRSQPSQLEVLLMVADSCEPGRHFPEAAAIREVAARSLEDALLLCLDSRIRYLLDRRLPVHPRTIAARNWWVLERRTGGGHGRPS